MTHLALLLLLVAQDDLSGVIERLAHDDYATRESATLDLINRGPQIIDRLEKEITSAGDPETIGRLKNIVATIEKNVEFEKVFGKVTTVTLSAKGRRLGDVLTDLEKGLGEKFLLKDVNSDTPVDLDLNNATMWEALDALAQSAGIQFRYGHEHIVISPAGKHQLPSRSFQQFRISLSELKVLERHTPEGVSRSAVAVLDVDYQRNMHPANHFAEPIEITSVTDARGNNVLSEAPLWIGGAMMGDCTSRSRERFHLSGDAKGPLTFEGNVNISFARETRDLGLALDGDGGSIVVGGVTIGLKGFSQTERGVRFTLASESDEEIGVSERLHKNSAFVIDCDGKRYPVLSRSSGGSSTSAHWNFECADKIKNPTRIEFRWITEFYRVEIPIRFEGVCLPEEGAR